MQAEIGGVAMTHIPTAEEIKAAMTVRGGWTRATLAQWGVPWPPPRGWRKTLESGYAVTRKTGPLHAIDRRDGWDCDHSANGSRRNGCDQINGQDARTSTQVVERACQLSLPLSGA